MLTYIFTCYVSFTCGNIWVYTCFIQKRRKKKNNVAKIALRTCKTCKNVNCPCDHFFLRVQNIIFGIAICNIVLNTHVKMRIVHVIISWVQFVIFVSKLKKENVKKREFAMWSFFRDWNIIFRIAIIWLKNM